MSSSLSLASRSAGATPPPPGIEPGIEPAWTGRSAGALRANDGDSETMAHVRAIARASTSSISGSPAAYPAARATDAPRSDANAAAVAAAARRRSPTDPPAAAARASASRSVAQHAECGPIPSSATVRSHMRHTRTPPPGTSEPSECRGDEARDDVRVERAGEPATRRDPGCAAAPSPTAPSAPTADEDDDEDRVNPPEGDATSCEAARATTSTPPGDGPAPAPAGATFVFPVSPSVPGDRGAAAATTPPAARAAAFFINVCASMLSPPPYRSRGGNSASRYGRGANVPDGDGGARSRGLSRGAGVAVGVGAGTRAVPVSRVVPGACVPARGAGSSANTVAASAPA